MTSTQYFEKTASMTASEFLDKEAKVSSDDMLAALKALKKETLDGLATAQKKAAEKLKGETIFNRKVSAGLGVGGGVAGAAGYNLATGSSNSGLSDISPNQRALN